MQNYYSPEMRTAAAGFFIFGYVWAGRCFVKESETLWKRIGFYVDKRWDKKSCSI